MPSGLISMWKGSIATIPSGWKLCDGNNGTPDLRDKFIVCAKQDDSGVAKSEVSGSLEQSGGTAYHDHYAEGNCNSGSYAPIGGVFDFPVIPVDVEEQYEIAVPYYALAFIMKL